MQKIERNILLSGIKKLLKPLVRFAVRHSVKMQEIIDIIKSAYVEAAEEFLLQKDEKVTDSRLSVITGLQRRDIAKFKSHEVPFDSSKTLITKVLGQWQNGRDFITAAGKPRVLSFGFKGCEFDKLVKAVSQDLNPATVLFELERTGSVKHTARGVQLSFGTYVPQGDLKHGLETLSQDSNDLLNAVEENLLENREQLNHHLRTSYDGIRSESIPQIKEWLLKEGHEFHSKAREYISSFDQDINPKKGYQGGLSKVVLTSFGKTYKDEK